MWSRKELKDKAKRVLGKNYWSAFGISLVIALAGGSEWVRKFGDSSNSNNSTHYFYSTIQDYSIFNWSFTTFVCAIFIATLVFRIFVGYCLEVGGRKYFIQSAQYKDNSKCLRHGFSKQNYFGVIKTMLLTEILLFFWTLLLIIPGIIKAYAYSMVPYILAENPNIGAEEAITLSNEMTKGHKLDMFILDLSFIGWYMLGVLALGVGIFFVMPYENATYAELYLVLREEAINKNLCSYEDLLLDKEVSE